MEGEGRGVDADVSALAEIHALMVEQEVCFIVLVEALKPYRSVLPYSTAWSN